MNEDFCIGCNLREDCGLVNIVNFCDNCLHAESCEIRSVGCDAGHDIECNNGYEEESEVDGE